MRESWTDDKLDALNEKIDLRFDHVDERLSRLETQAETQRSEIQEGFAAIAAKFDAKFDSLHRQLIYVLISFPTVLVAAAGVVVAVVK